MNGIDFSIISVLVGLFIGLGTLIAGCGFAYAQFKTGGDKAKDDLIDTLKEAVEVEKAKGVRLTEEKAILIDSHQSQINELNNKMGKLQGLYEASEQSKKEYLAILQGRDPANQKFIESQSKFMEIVMRQIEENQKTTPAVQAYMAETTKILMEIRHFMSNLNDSSQANRQFLSEVAEDTKSGEGEPLRKKTI